MSITNTNQRLEKLRESLDLEIEKAFQHQSRAPENAQDLEHLVETLKIYQAELEMQNAALAESNDDNDKLRRYYSSLFSSSPLACFVVDAKLLVHEQNQAAKSLFSEQSKGGPIVNLGHVLPHELAFKLIQTLSDAACENSFEERVGSRFSEESRVLHFHTAGLKLEEDNQGHFLIMIEDVSVMHQFTKHRELLLSVLDNAHDSIVVLDMNGAVKVCSEQTKALFDLDETTAVLDLMNSLPEAIASFVRSYVFLQVVEMQPREAILQIAGSEPEQSRHIHARAFPITEGKTLDGAGFIFSDCTDRLNYENELGLALKVFNAGQQAIVVASADGNMIRVNRAFEEITGFTPAEVNGKPLSILLSSNRENRDASSLLSAVESQQSWEGEAFLLRDKVSHFPAWASLSGYPDDDTQPTHLILTFRDITKQKLHEQQIEKLAFYDSLTSCGNRRLLEQTVNTLISRCDPNLRFSLFFFDIDFFKQINDIFGHEVGDKVLQALTNRIQHLIRETDCMFRIGGDEFIILFDSLVDEDIGAKASKLIEVCKQNLKIGTRDISSSVSMGIVTYPDDGDDYNTLLKRADLALYQAKNNGRAQFQFYDPCLMQKMARHVQVEQNLRAALKTDEIYFDVMPIANCDDQEICELELLMRWKSSTLGQVYPDEFVAVAEKSDLIHELTTLVVNQAKRSIKALDEKGFDKVRVAINISPKDLKNSSYYLSLLSRLDQDQFRGRIVIEITENVFIDDLGDIQEKLEQLSSVGALISIDDFGTGYSSMQYLTDLTIDKIKIDRAFVSNVLENYKSASICRAVIALSNAIGTKCTAEGVETAEQLDWLNEHYCDTYQGYFCSKPVSHTEIFKLLEETNANTQIKKIS